MRIVSHPAFRMGDAAQVRKHLKFLPIAPCVVGFLLRDNAGGDEWENIIVVLNANKEAREVDIPQGRYIVVGCDGVISEAGLGQMDGGRITVDAQSALILHN